MSANSARIYDVRKRTNLQRIINGDADAVQLHPVPPGHQFALDAYHTANANHWLPNEIPMTEDKLQWASLTQPEQDVVKISLGFFATGDSIVANNLVLSIYRHITSAPCRLYLIRQAYDECIHTHSYQYVIESLGLDEDEIFSMWKTRSSIYDKDDFVSQLCAQLRDPSFRTGTPAADQAFLENLIDFGVVMEGIFFYATFAAMFSFRRRGLLPGTALSFQYIARDESCHANFCIDLIKQIRVEHPTLWTDAFQKRVVEKVATAATLEEAFARDMMPNGIMGMNADSFRDYTRHIADRRLESLGIPPQFRAANPFPWMSEVIDLRKSANFFESRVTEYQSGGALEFDNDF